MCLYLRFCKTTKSTNTYKLLQISVEMNTRGSKTHAKYDLQGQSFD